MKKTQFEQIMQEFSEIKQRLNALEGGFPVERKAIPYGWAFTIDPPIARIAVCGICNQSPCNCRVPIEGQYVHEVKLYT